jgi:FMN-dependent NADH-azoreductase
MPERKRRRSQSNTVLWEIIERLREYEPEEVVVICNKYLARRNLPPLDPAYVEKTLSQCNRFS